MKLSDLIQYRESLDYLEHGEVAQEMLQKLRSVLTTCSLSPMDIKQHMNAVTDIFARLNQNIQDFDGEIQDLKDTVDAKIQDESRIYFARSYEVFEKINQLPLDNVLFRELRCDADDSRLFSHRIKFNSNWLYPGALIRPALSNFMNDMIDSDPFYLVDIDQQLLTPTLKSLTSVMRGRVRTGVVNERSQPHLPSLPDSQLGLIVAWNFFNYMPLEYIKQYLEEIWCKLRPGGACLFTYNNASRFSNMILVEHNFASYTPDWCVIAAATNIGFEISHKHDGCYHMCWLEIKKPGEKKTLRAGQSLAMIHPKPQDDAAEVIPMTDERHILLKEARDLNITALDDLPTEHIKIIVKQQRNRRELDLLRALAVKYGIESPKTVINLTLEELQLKINKWRNDNERSSS